MTTTTAFLAPIPVLRTAPPRLNRTHLPTQKEKIRFVLRKRAQCTATAPPTTTEHRERNITFQTSSFNFYRPASQIVRDLGVLALSALPHHSPIPPPYTVLDACSASGIRALRYLNPPCPVSHVRANDTHRISLHDILLSNLSAHIRTDRAIVTNLPAERCLLDTTHDLVDLDLFGASGEPVVGRAIDGVSPHGLLYLCATDSVTGAGRNPAVSYAAYGAATSVLPSANEQFLRLVIGAAHRAALARGRTLRPVFSYFHRKSSTARVMLQLDAGETSLQSVGFLRNCRACGQNESVPLESACEAYVCSCGAGNVVGGEARVVATGPTWIAPLHDAAFLQSMRDVADELHRPSDDWGSVMDFVDQLRDEAELPPLYYPLGDVGKAIAGSMPRVDAIGERLAERGYTVVKACAAPRCVKTDAPYKTLVQAAREAADEVQGKSRRSVDDR